MKTIQNNPSGVGTIAKPVSDWQQGEVSLFTQPKIGLVTLQVPRGLPRRKLYIYFSNQSDPQVNVEFEFDAQVVFLLDGTPVGSFPICNGSGGIYPAVNYTQTKACIAISQPAVGNTAIAADSILISLTAVIAPQDPFYPVILAPQNFYGEFDTIRVDVTRMLSVGYSRLWIGCMSTQQ